MEDKYGLMLFGMGLTYLVEIGLRNLSENDVEESVRQIMEKGAEDEANGVTSVMTPEFQCNIVRCAGELANFSIWCLFSYIKNDVEISKIRSKK